MPVRPCTPVLFCAVVAALAFAGPAGAQWPIGGMRLTPSDSAASSPVLTSDGAGGVIVAWFDHRDVDIHPYVTRRLADGTTPAGWVAGGAVLAGDTGGDPTIGSDGIGGAYVGWKYFGDVAIQHVTAAGAIGGDWYPPNGATLPGQTELLGARVAAPTQTEHEESLHADVFADSGVGVVGVYVNNGRFFNSGWVWKLYRPEVTPPAANSYYGLVDPSEYDQNLAVACDDGARGVVVAYSGENGLAVRRYAEDGSPPAGWPASTEVVIAASDFPAALGICADGVGGAFVVSCESDSGSYSRFLGLTLRHVRQDASLDPTWPAEGLSLASTPNEAGLVRGDDPWGGYRPTIVADGTGGACIAWTDLRSDAGDIYAARVLANGQLAPGWPEGGLRVSGAAGKQEFPQASPDGLGGVYLAWVDCGVDPGGDLVAMHLSGQGLPAPGWPDGGRAVADGPGSVVMPRLISDGRGGAYVAWADTRDGAPQIELERLEAGGLASAGPDAELAGRASVLLGPDPWRRDLAVRFTLAHAASVRFELFDVSGRSCGARAFGTLGAGEHAIRIAPDGEAPAGVYLVRLWMGGTSAVARTVHVR